MKYFVSPYEAYQGATDNQIPKSIFFVESIWKMEFFFASNDAEIPKIRVFLNQK